MPLLTSLFISSVLAIILTTLGLTLGMKIFLDREKTSPFECGFTPKTSARLPFSIRFFLISIVFLIFDVELILIFPSIPSLFVSPSITVFSATLLVMVVLIVGLFYEAAQGSLAWAE